MINETKAIILNPQVNSNLTERLDRFGVIPEYAERLRKKNSNELGFVPFTTYQNAWANRKIIVALTVESYLIPQLLGFLWWTQPSRRERKIKQLCVHTPHRRKGIANQLMKCLIDNTKESEAKVISLRCREDLTIAQHIWRNAGFIEASTYIIPGARKLRVSNWELYFPSKTS